MGLQRHVQTFWEHFAACAGIEPESVAPLKASLLATAAQPGTDRRWLRYPCTGCDRELDITRGDEVFVAVAHLALPPGKGWSAKVEHYCAECVAKLPADERR